MNHAAVIEFTFDSVPVSSEHLGADSGKIPPYFNT
jgi:hypothetical protein